MYIGKYTMVPWSRHWVMFSPQLRSFLVVCFGPNFKGLEVRGNPCHYLSFYMSDYAQQTVDLHKNIAKVDKLKHAAT